MQNEMYSRYLINTNWLAPAVAGPGRASVIGIHVPGASGAPDLLEDPLRAAAQRRIRTGGSQRLAGLARGLLATPRGEQHPRQRQTLASRPRLQGQPGTQGGLCLLEP